MQSKEDRKLTQKVKKKKEKQFIILLIKLSSIKLFCQQLYPKNFEKPAMALRWDLYYPDISSSEVFQALFDTFLTAATTSLTFYFKRSNPILILFVTEHCWHTKYVSVN